MPVPGVPWGGRDTSVLSHELIHRWIHDGADPAALDSARLRHAARGEELRAAAQRLELAHGRLGASWRGRDADAAAAHVRTLVARMSRLGDAVTGQAGSLQGVRDALARVQSLVGHPRAPALPVLGRSPATPGLAGALATGGPADGFGTFQAAQAEERAAQHAYRAYLQQTGLAARGAPSAVDGLAGRTTVGAAPEGGATARGAAAGPGAPPAAGEGAPGGRGVLARAAGPAPASGTASRSGPGAPRPPGAGGGAPGAGAVGVPPGGRPAGGAARGLPPAARSDAARSDAARSDAARSDAARSDLGRSAAARSDAGRPDVGRSDAGRPGAARSDTARPGTVGRFVSRLLGGPPGPSAADGPPGPRAPGGPPTGRPAPRSGPPGTTPPSRGPAHPVTPTAADRLAGGAPRGGPVERRRAEHDEREEGVGREDGVEHRRAAGPAADTAADTAAGTAAGTPGPSHSAPDRLDDPRPTGPSLAGPTVGAGGHPAADGTGTPGTPAPPAVSPPAPDVPMIPPAAGAAGGVDTGVTGGARHPEYLVDADPWRDPADDPGARRLVTPPVIGEQDGP